MKTLAIVLLGACGPIYPASNQTPPPQEPVTSSGPPGGQMDPYQPPGSGSVDPAPPPSEMSTPKPAPRPTGSTLSPDAETFITEHNRYRAKHCAAPLSWSAQLAADAQTWADTLKAKGCVFGHSGGKHGENLAAGTTGAVPPEEVVRMWYDEVKIYDFKKPTGFSMETGHFTQVVWLDTQQVGCGMAQCNGNDIWVCQYEKPGNWEGQYKQKVLPTSCK